MNNILKLVTIAIIIVSFQWGCSNNSVTESDQIEELLALNKPEKKVDNLQLQAKRFDASYENQVSQIIDGKKGGFIIISNIQKKGVRYILTNGTLFIPEGAFDGVKEIKIFTNVETASVQFYPQMKFDKPLVLNLLFTGLSKDELDSQGFIQKNKIGFYSITDYGSKELVSNDGIIFKPETGKLGINNARINNFSKYYLAD